MLVVAVAQEGYRGTWREYHRVVMPRHQTGARGGRGVISSNTAPRRDRYTVSRASYAVAASIIATAHPPPSSARTHSPTRRACARICGSPTARRMACARPLAVSVCYGSVAGLTPRCCSRAPQKG